MNAANEEQCHPKARYHSVLSDLRYGIPHFAIETSCNCLEIKRLAMTTLNQMLLFCYVSNGLKE